MKYIIPEDFIRTTIELFGERGSAWLENFPDLLDSLERRWGFRLLPPFELSYNYVAPAVRSDGSEVVLKVGVPNNELLSEMTSLEHWNGRGIVRLIEADFSMGAMLLERISPGITLADRLAAGEISDDEATRTAAEVMHDLWIPAPPDPQGALCTVLGWARGFERLRGTFSGSTGPFPPAAVEHAENIYTDLLAEPGQQMLLHGDLHHWNIISANRLPWLALDPKGLIGEAEYETGALLRNPWASNVPEALDLARRLPRRIAILSEMLGFDRDRVRLWAASQAVLSAWWSYEDHGYGWEPMIAFAQELFNGN